MNTLNIMVFLYMYLTHNHLYTYNPLFLVYTGWVKEQGREQERRKDGGREKGREEKGERSEGGERERTEGVEVREGRGREGKQRESCTNAKETILNFITFR